MFRFLGALVFGAVLLTPTLVKADDDHERREDRKEVRRYHDKEFKDDHEWNDTERQAYRRYYDDQHREYREWDRVNAKRQQDYWRWRHSHSDALLQLNIH